ncbi:MAG: flavodoxin domain-containing protein [Minicystis sp.]
MKILVTHGSERGGTAGIADRIGATLREAGVAVDVQPAREVRDVRAYDAVIVGGALYANRWHADARRFVLRHAAALRARPVWFFSSGPLDDSADHQGLPPTPPVQQLMDFVGASGHATFGGRLAPDAHGFVAASMAKTHAGDFRNMARIDAWARDVAHRIEEDSEHPEQLVARAPVKPLPSAALPAILCLLAGVPALLGGAALVLRPDGLLLQAPLALLRHAPFSDFFVPGLLLLLVIGVGNTWAGYLHLVREDFAGLASFVSGNALLVWTVVEMILLRTVHPLQIGYLLLAVAIVAASIHEVRTLMPPGSGARPAPSAG